MRILYGVVGEGMGHATRSRVLLEHLAARGHEVKVVVSGRAHRFLTEKLAHLPQISVQEIHGLSLVYQGNRVDKSASLKHNVLHAGKGIRKNIRAYRKVAEAGFMPELVISDFESWAALYALNHFLPVISVDNMQIINRCEHPRRLLRAKGEPKGPFRMAKLAVKAKIPGAYHYLVSSFFFPPVRKKRTTLVGPILRPEILQAAREPGEHVLVYQTQAANPELLAQLGKLPYEFRVYGLGQEGSQKNLTMRPFSERGFVEDLRTARAVIAGGGYSLMSEAVHLGVPLYSVPVEQQFEQELNARYLKELGYGDWARELDLARVEDFLEETDAHAQALESYPRQDNSQLFRLVDELIERRARGEARPVRLESPSMGSYGAAPAAEAREDGE
ncbi:MAG: teichoic acid biosynthesis protein [Polyangiaceae bacterium]|nr:teichoic acid biosynthesis protein [Polyangiaceae bacterium]MCW5789317.1 teichoic acid biosynthesis protein [Polyangiaceae bacterium]